MRHSITSPAWQRLGLRLPLLALLLPLAAHAQTPDDSLKGRIWTATAQRIWADTKPRAPQPPAWPTNTAFVSWLGAQGKSEKSGIGLLRGDVVRALGPGQPATAAQVAQAIVAEASQPPRSRQWLQKLDVPALQTALHRLAPAVALPAAASESPVLASSGDSLGTPLPPASGVTITDDSSFFGQRSWLAALLGLLAGAGLALAVLRSTRRRHRHSLMAHAAPAAAPGSSAEVLRLQNEVQRLAHYIKELESKVLHYENASAADAALAPDDEPALAPPVPPAQLPHPAEPPADEPAWRQPLPGPPPAV